MFASLIHKVWSVSVACNFFRVHENIKLMFMMPKFLDANYSLELRKVCLVIEGAIPPLFKIQNYNPHYFASGEGVYAVLSFG